MDNQFAPNLSLRLETPSKPFTLICYRNVIILNEYQGLLGIIIFVKHRRMKSPICLILFASTSNPIIIFTIRNTHLMSSDSQAAGPPVYKFSLAWLKSPASDNWIFAFFNGRLFSLSYCTDKAMNVPYRITPRLTCKHNFKNKMQNSIWNNFNKGERC
jgi:hypothetical protein